MSFAKIVAVVAGAVLVACALFVVTLLVVKAMWAWTIPDLFPGAVAQGLVARTISWLTAIKVAIFVGVLSGLREGSIRWGHSSSQD